MNLSYWEHTTWLRHIDFAITGSGIVGLSTALSLRERFPTAKIVVLEKGILPSGASTKNAGFACFGSVSEILADLETHPREVVVDLVAKRASGLELLKKTLGEEALRYRNLGGYELFRKTDTDLYEKCLSQVSRVNKLLQPIFGEDVFSVRKDPFGFGAIQKQIIFNKLEGQIDTGSMMRELLKKAAAADILVLNSAEVTAFAEMQDAVSVEINKNVEIRPKKLLIATNGFAGQFLDEAIEPARAQVLITKPIEDLHIRGTFHIDEGFYYFRNVENRILFGGGRNLDFEAEKTTETGLTERIQNSLEDMLSTTILPGRTFEIEDRWSGIMGVGPRKKPIVKQLSTHVYCGVRLGGMGVAIGSSIGRELADLV